MARRTLRGVSAHTHGARSPARLTDIVAGSSESESYPSRTDGSASAKAGKAHLGGAGSSPTPVHYKKFDDIVHSKVCSAADGKDFVPADDIESLTSRDIVERQLKAIVAAERLESLVDYVMNSEQPAKRIFLTLVVCDDLKRLQTLADAPHRFGDKDLPVEVRTNPDELTGTVSYDIHSVDGGMIWPEFSSSRKQPLSNFSHHQWLFLAPIFTGDAFHHNLHSACPLPIIQKINHNKTGFFSTVFEVVVHDAHQRVLPAVAGKKTRVASKEMRIGMDSYYEKEAGILDTIRKVEHPHLIKPLAAYRRGDLRGFLFPWGEGGNLKELWGNQETKPHVPVKDPKHVLWVLQQLQGICGSISALHERNCRHGDLKPENILHFHESDEGGILRVADVGLARFHIEATRDRKQVTNTMTGTVRYEPPEFGHTNQISRLYDVWSLGCVFLEFLIWVLYGNTKLRDFNRASIEEKFWSKDEDGDHQHREVKKWISRMSKDLKGTGIASNSALEDVLKLIDLKMLVPKVEGRTNSTELYQELKGIFLKAQVREEYLMDPTLWDRISTRAVPAEQKRQTLEVPGQRPAPSRASRSRDLPSGRFERTPDTSHVENPMIIEPSVEIDGIRVQAPTPNAQEVGKNILTYYSTLRYPPEKLMLIRYSVSTCEPYPYQVVWSLHPVPANRCQQLAKLQDIWELESDSNFAEEFYRKSSFSPPTLQESDLCRTCMGYDIWSPMFSVSARLGDLKSRSQSCMLCAVLAQSVETRGMSDDDQFKCRRNGSSLKMEPDGSTIVALYVAPGDRPTPPQAQTGYPILPETGSSQQFTLLNEWLRVCDEQHDHHIDKHMELPTRIIDVGTTPDSIIRLCDGKSLPLERYIALSHCWGVNSRAQVRTLKENIDVFRRRIDFDSLPKSFQDAVTIARVLRVRYLWIDSLCIIQNDKQDWAFEATRMEHVFSSAYCTIAATAASSSAEGFLRQKSKHSFATLTGPSGSFTFVRKAIDNFHQDVEQAVLNQRGWVLQERALSRRTLHFTATQVYWECGRGVHCESLMRLSKPTSRQAALLGDSNFPESALELFKGGRIRTFQTLYEMYSRLAFTVPSDRSIGIKGLEERLVKNFETKGGFGIFEEYLQRSLLWQRAPDTSLDRILYSPDRRVPSWSWMAYRGPIAYLEAPFEHINWTDDIVTPFNTDSGKKTHWQVSEGSEITLLRGLASRFGLDPIELHKRVTFDESTDHSVDQLLCIVIGQEKTEGMSREPEHYVIVISKLSDERGGRYERVGVGKLLGKHIIRDPQLTVDVQ
ncbi:serine/threonine protein kinase [Colletotrichum cuscutae]|uniref:Serine/threonine protein kinase n=1 Tax=Colletotrichum cuscutae TaxID=1209917 RepID=A0AAI9VBG5_9PEZI|nr:serine/threonine protein kinase [Colletotrichum cuscutae]